MISVGHHIRWALCLTLLVWAQAAAAQRRITAGEYFLGANDPGPGNGTAFTVVDGAWDDVVESIQALAQTINPGASPVLVNLRVRDGNQAWGPLYRRALFFGAGTSTTRQLGITQAECFFGAFDPGQGNGTPVLAFDGAFDEAVETAVASITNWNLNNGLALFNIRVKDATGNWGPRFQRTLFVGAGNTSTRPLGITQAECFFGAIDPGTGNGTPVLAFDGAFDEAVETALTSITNWSQSNGSTLFNIRVKDANGNWGPRFQRTLFVGAGTASTRPMGITQAECFFGAFDPGEGNGTTVLALDGAFDEAVETAMASITNWNLNYGAALFNIRVKDASGNWGPRFQRTLFIGAGTSNTRSLGITQAEYFFGSFDPGEGSGTPILAFDGGFGEAVEAVFRNWATWTNTTGPALFNIRVKDAYGNWGPRFLKTVFPYGANPNAELIAQGAALSTCPGSSVVLNYSGPVGHTVTWFNGAQSESITFVPPSTGYYGVTATQGSVTYVDSILITLLPAPAPVISPGGNVLVCAGSNLTLTVNTCSGCSYQWLLNGTNIANATNTSYLPITVGSYTVRVIGTNGCATVSAPTVVQTTPTVTATSGTALCNGQGVTLSANGSAGSTYQWRLNGTTIPGATASTYVAAVAGSYSVTVTRPPCSATSAAIVVSGGAEQTYYADTDGDTFGDATNITISCTGAPPGYVSNATDCDDADVSAYPGAPCNDGLATTINDVYDTDCTCAGTSTILNLSLKVFLEGPFVGATGLMSDALRTAGLLPLQEPYSALGYSHVGGGGGEQTPAAVLAVSGNNAIVDWVVVELRLLDVNVRFETRSALLQRDGDVVAMDGVSPLAFNVGAGSYHVSVKHRNHLGVMTATPLSFSGAAASFDFTAGASAVFGTDARKIIGSARVLWAGDVSFNGQLKYTGAANDRDPILSRIGGVVPTNFISGYLSEDVNMDGVVRYTGSGNDRDSILQNIGGVVPTNTRSEQVP